MVGVVGGTTDGDIVGDGWARVVEGPEDGRTVGEAPAFGWASTNGAQLGDLEF